jgi:hypothetical protein
MPRNQLRKRLLIAPLGIKPKQAHVIRSHRRILDMF